MAARSLIAPGVVWLMVVGCGSSDPISTGQGDAEGGARPPDAGQDSGLREGGGPLPAIDPTRDISSLTDVEKAVLCDWKNALMGGYGVVNDCGGFNATNDIDQATCVSFLHFRCPVTVGEYETCIPALAENRGCFPPVGKCDPLACS